MELLAIPSLVVVLSLWVAHSIILNRRLLQSQSRYQQFFNDSPVAHIVIDKNHKIIEWNLTAEIIFGWNEEEAKQKNIIDFLVPEFDQSHVLSILQKAASEGLSHSKNYNITQTGQEIFCEWRNRMLEGTDGEILCMAQDITVSQKTLNDLHKRSTALESVGDAILYTNEKGIIEFANRSFFLLNLSDPDKVYGSHIGSYLFEDKMNFSALNAQFKINDTWRGTISKTYIRTTKVLSVTITAIFHRNHLVSYVANLHDITDLHSHVDTLTHQAKYDPLTGALNRGAMEEELSLVIARSQRSGQKAALYFIDLNDFKLINDQFGHDAGDLLLKSISHNLRACLRTTDTICRYGGDEFVIIIENIKDKEYLLTVFETIHTAICEPIQISKETIIRPRASIGMALYPDNASTSEELLRVADSAMYKVKKEKHRHHPKSTSPSSDTFVKQ